MVWPSYNLEAPSLAMGSLEWVVDPYPLVPLQVQMVWISKLVRMSIPIWLGRKSKRSGLK